MRRLRRVCLTVPAIDPAKLAKAAGLDVDEVVIDLEDAIPVDRKTGATRRLAADAVAGLAWRAPIVAVRVNGIATPWFRDDVEALVRLAGPGLAAIVLPKVEAAASVAEARRLLEQLGSGAGLEALIETALGVVRVDEIAAAGAGLEALVFGAGDYAASLGLSMPVIGGFDPAYPGDQWAYPRARIAAAAHAFGLDAIDGPYAAYRDVDGLRESARRARAVGMTGKWAIHPAQVPVCLEVFSPTDEEEAGARRTLAALDQAAAGGRGAAAADGAMIDEASRRQAEGVLARARGRGAR